MIVLVFFYNEKENIQFKTKLNFIVIYKITTPETFYSLNKTFKFN